jgi:hypothetical protein
MNPENLVTQVQLALIGVILVVGLFFMWRTICRIEEKVDALRNAGNLCAFAGGNTSARNEMSDEEAMQSAEKLMNDVFHAASNTPYVVYSEDIHVEDVEDEDVEQEQEGETPAEPAIKVPETPEPSEPDGDQNPLSKTKLRKMNVEELKELCRQRGLPVDGSKNLLVDRILGVAH